MKKSRFKILLASVIFISFHISVNANGNPDKLDFRLSRLLWEHENPTVGKLFKVVDDHNLLRVSIRFQTLPADETIHEMELQGIRFDYLNNKILHIGRIYEAYVPIDRLGLLTSSQNILNIESADYTNHLHTINVSNGEIQARQTWDYPDDKGHFLTGRGITIAINDDPADIFHPAFWRADGDTFKWIDTNANNKFDNGVDGVDLNLNNAVESNEILAFFKAPVNDIWDIFPGDYSEYRPDMDWLYNDVNKNNIRDFGPKNGFTESDPTYGEQIFVCIDQNQNNALDTDEPLIALKTCKIKAIYANFGWDYENYQWIYRTLLRGQDLIELPKYTTHATAVAGILAAGCRGVHKFTGIAPDADIIIGPPAWAREMKADIILYESGVFINKFLDGSSNEEEAVDSLAAAGIIQVLPAGNLKNVRRHFHSEIAPRDSISVRILSPAPQFNPGNPYLVSLLWRNPENSPEISIVSPENDLFKISGLGTDFSLDDFNIWSQYSISSRKTAKMDIGVYRASGISGTWHLKMRNKHDSPQIIDGYIFDGPYSFQNGSVFGDFVSQSTTIMAPATADSAVAVGSYNTRDLNGTIGDLSDYSSIGPRVDGKQILDICAPGNVIFTTNCHNPDNSNLGGYWGVSGTSFSAPHAAGAITLLLQLDSAMTTQKLVKILQQGANHDNYTGSTPNNSWGGGKLRILNSLQLLPQFKDKKKESEIFPEDFILYPNYPNPFNHFTIINFSIPKSTLVNIQIFNINGQLLKTLFNGPLPAGDHSLRWDATLFSSGIYFIKMKAGDYKSISKCTLLK
ncbi:S8 family peptidase [candidate division KSB1 bacterium]|nr:S8 family peptidase [candidate division KSB1 bacterium]